MTDFLPVEPTVVDPWPERRRRYFRDHPRRCAVCGIPDVELHHRRYDAPRGWENDKDLVPLCRLHHRQVHRWHDKATPKDELPYRWLSMVTTLAIVVLRGQLFVRRPGVVMGLTTFAGWWAGVWLPLLALAAMGLSALVKEKN